MFVVDDDESMRQSLLFLIRSAGYQAEAFASAEDFLGAYQPEQRGCLLLDVRMPGMNGIQLQDELQRRGATLPVIILTAHGDVPMAVRAMRAGAFDFIEKPSNDEQLLNRVRDAIEFNSHRQRDQSLAQQAMLRYEQLSPREREVMRLVVQGLLNKQIAAELNISIKTVEVHRARVMEKMGAASLAELVRMAVVSDIE